MISLRKMGVVVITATLGLIGAAAPAQADINLNQYVATVSNGTWSFQVHLTDSDDIQDAFASLDQTSNKHINGGILAETEYNDGYNWHLDPHDVAFVNVSMELCDGSPQDVEAGLITGRYCPWGGKVVNMERVYF